MDKEHPALKTATLPQYQESFAFMERFLDAIHFDNEPIARAKNTDAIKMVDGFELQGDYLQYFEDNEEEMENEFFGELVEAIGYANAIWFCFVVAREWYDGKGSRTGKHVLALKRAVSKYISETHNVKKLDNIVVNHDMPEGISVLSPDDIGKIIQVNNSNLFKHIEKWKERHPNALSIRDDSIFLRRGLAISELIDTTVPYREWDYINSYSIAFSAPEKFAQMTTGKVAAIVNGDYDLYKNRILFFSPFIPGMNIGQLEFGIIPRAWPHNIRYQMCHSGIHEYILDPAFCVAL